jgi:D-amino-acid oxidase
MAVGRRGPGCDVRVVADATVEATTSYIAAGVWFPTHVGPPGKVAAWGAGPWRSSPGKPGNRCLASSCASPWRCTGRPDWAAAVGSIRETATAELPPGYAYGLRFAVPQAEMPAYLPWLMRQVRDRGGEIVPQHVTDLAELSGAGVDALINCPGLAARDLVGDQSVYPVRV